MMPLHLTIMRLAIAVLLVLGSVMPTAALALPGKYDAVVAAFQSRLAATPPGALANPAAVDATLVQHLSNSINSFIAEHGQPLGTGAVHDAVVDNIVQFMNDVPDATITQYRTRASAVPAQAPNMIRVMNAIAFFTVADPAIIARPANSQTAAWARVAAGQPFNLAGPLLSEADWFTIFAQYDGYIAARNAAYGDPTLSTYGPQSVVRLAVNAISRAERQRLAAEDAGDAVAVAAADAAIAAATASLQLRQRALRVNIQEPFALQGQDAWIAHLKAELNSLYAGRGVDIPPGFLDDMAVLAYVMTGLRSENGDFNLVGLHEMRRIEARLAGHRRLYPDASPERRLRSVLDRILTRHGFRPERVTATGLLATPPFASIVGAGLLLDDPGAGLEHGRFAHSLQLATLCLFYERNPGLFRHSMLELYQMIGAFERRTAAGYLGLETLFIFERNIGGLWGRTFDRPELNLLRTDLSHPDQILTAIRQRPELQLLLTDLSALYDERAQAATVAYRDIWSWVNPADPMSAATIMDLQRDAPEAFDEIFAEIQRLQGLMAANMDRAVEIRRAIGNRINLLQEIREMKRKGLVQARVAGVEISVWVEPASGLRDIPQELPARNLARAVLLRNRLLAGAADVPRLSLRQRANADADFASVASSVSNDDDAASLVSESDTETDTDSETESLGDGYEDGDVAPESDYDRASAPEEDSDDDVAREPAERDADPDADIDGKAQMEDADIARNEDARAAARDDVDLEDSRSEASDVAGLEEEKMRADMERLEQLEMKSDAERLQRLETQSDLRKLEGIKAPTTEPGAVGSEAAAAGEAAEAIAVALPAL